MRSARAVAWVLAAALAVASGTAGPGPGAAADTAGGGEAGRPQPPIRISADAAEYFNKENRVVFTGTVVAVQQESTLTAESMEVLFSEPARGEGGPAGAGPGAAPGRQVTQITALGKVTLRQVDPESGKERFATGEKGVYDAGRRLMTMTGGPRLWEGQNVIVGEEMVFNLEDRNVTVRGKVNLTVYPDEAGEAKKP